MQIENICYTNILKSIYDSEKKKNEEGERNGARFEFERRKRKITLI